jgi:hypothetical protein
MLPSILTTGTRASADSACRSRVAAGTAARPALGLEPHAAAVVPITTVESTTRVRVKAGLLGRGRVATEVSFWSISVRATAS